MNPEVRIGVVEDAEVVRAHLARLVEEHPGWRMVAACGSLQEARRQLPACQPQLVLLDLRLPDGSGADLIPWLRSRLPGVTVVLLTVVEDPPEILRAIQQGACGYLLKRDAVGLRRRIQEILDGGAPVMSPAVARHLWEWARNHPGPATMPGDLGLTPREEQVLRCMARGHSEEAIGRDLGIALNTVKVHRRHIYDKLGVHSRVAAVLKLRGGPAD